MTVRINCKYSSGLYCPMLRLALLLSLIHILTRVVQEIGDKVSVVNGHGEFLEPYAAMAGTAGFISSMSNFAPEKAVAIWEARSTGDYAKAKAIRDTMVPYMDLACKYSAMGGEYKVCLLYTSARRGSLPLRRNPRY